MMFKFFKTDIVNKSVISNSNLFKFALIPFLTLILIFIFIDTKNIKKTCVFFVIDTKEIFGVNHFVFVRRNYPSRNLISMRFKLFNDIHCFIIRFHPISFVITAVLWTF